MTKHLVIHALYYIIFRFLQIFPYMKLVKALTNASKIIPCLYTIKYKNNSKLLTAPSTKQSPFPMWIGSQKLQRDWALCVLVHFFFSNWKHNSSLEERTQIHSNMDEKIHCSMKEILFLKQLPKRSYQLASWFGQQTWLT